MWNKFKKAIAHLTVLSSLSVLIGFIISCAVPTTTTRTYKMIPAVPDRFVFAGFDIPEHKSPASVPLTIAVVEPLYKERLGTDYSKAVKSFSNHVGTGLDEILIAKGVTTKGPYDSLDELPYPDKLNSNLTLTQTVYIYVSEKGPVSTVHDTYETSSRSLMDLEVETYQMTVEFWITFEMREPLSAQKMWIKKLDLGTLEKNYEIGYSRKYISTPPADPCVAPPMAPTTGSYVKGKMVFNTKTGTFANILNHVYPEVIQKAWTYLNADEMLSLNDKVKEIRELKRY